MLIYADNVTLNRYKQKDLIHITVCRRMASTDAGHFYTIPIRHIATRFIQNPYEIADITFVLSHC